ncbi:MAG: sigma-70 family RNA polymerase sigma factor, partial [Paracoccaceae bacterium]
MAAFRLLYDMTSPRLMGVALRICRERQMAEDVLQDIYVQVWQRAGSYDPTRASAMAWMMAITRNRSIDHIRRLAARAVLAGRLVSTR